MKERWLMSTPTMTPLARQTINALALSGALPDVATTLSARRNGTSAGEHFLRSLGRMSSRFRSRMQSRTVENVRHLHTMWRWEVARLMSGRLDSSGVLTDRVWELGHDRYDRWVARLLNHQHDRFFAFETAAYHSLREAQRLGISSVLEVSSAELGFVHALFREQAKQTREVDTPWMRNAESRLPPRRQRRLREWDLADRVLVHSRYCLSTWEAGGVDIEKALVIPLPAPPVGPARLHRPHKSAPLRMIWAGTFGVRKGAQILLQAWAKRPSGATLDVYGSVELKPSSDHLGITFHGSIPHAQLLDAMRGADVLLFPTLSDAFGMVATEAMAMGLPVLTTHCAGAADLIGHEVHGLIIEAGEVDALSDAMSWCADNIPHLVDMGEAARQKVAKWQWPDYQRKLIAVL